MFSTGDLVSPKDGYIGRAKFVDFYQDLTSVYPDDQAGDDAFAVDEGPHLVLERAHRTSRPDRCCPRCCPNDLSTGVLCLARKALAAAAQK